MATTTQATAMPKQKISLRERLDMGSGMLPYYLVAPTIIIIALVAVYPIIDSIRLSLLDNPLIASGAAFVGLRNYIQVLGDPAFKSSVGITLIFSVVSVALETLVGFGVALLMNKAFPGRGLVRTAILIPFAFPTIVSAQIWYLMFNAQNGVLTYLLQSFHLLAQGDSLLRTTPGVITAAVIIDVWKTTPFMALLLLAGLQVIPDELYEAASVDGGTRWQQFWSITFPLLRSALFIALVVVLIIALGPVYWTAITSIKVDADINSSPPTLFPHSFTIANYTQAFLSVQRAFAKDLLNSTIVAIVTTILALIFGSICAY